MVNIGRKNTAEKRTDRLCCQISFKGLVTDMKMSAGKGKNELRLTSLHDTHWCHQQTLSDSSSLEHEERAKRKKTDK